jgi:hypothetical protein
VEKVIIIIEEKPMERRIIEEKPMERRNSDYLPRKNLSIRISVYLVGKGGTL